MSSPILTLHGLASSTSHWRFFDAHYASRQILSFEYRGHGGKPPDGAHTPGNTGGPYSIEQFAEDAYDVWRRANAGPAIVTGLSFGVQVALELYRRHPDAVRALVLICGTAGKPFAHVTESAPLRKALTSMVRGFGSAGILAAPILALLRSGVGRRLASEMAYASGGAMRESCPRDVLDDLFGHVGAMHPSVIAEVTASYLEHDAFDVLPTIAVPTLIVAADRDQLTPVATSERMRDAIPGATLVVFPGHSHLVQVEDPDGVHAAIDAFLETVER